MGLNREVSPEGPVDAFIVLIGEAPAETEVSMGRPFQGSAGNFLNNLLSGAGLKRGSLYITNLSKERAPKNKMDNVPYKQLQLWRDDLIEEINLLPNPKILVPLGNYALKAVTGRSGITNLRGSVLAPVSDISHDCIVIPTIHPSALHYNYSVWPLISADFVKIKRLSEQTEPFKFPEFNFKIQPSFEETMSFLDWLDQNTEMMVTLDVETPHMLLSCIGIAWSRSDAFCIPFYWGDGRNYWTEDEEFVLWKRLSEVLPKINWANQNVFFDWEIMLNYGIRLKAPVYDSMLMHSCLYSELPHKLEVIVSIYTDIEFYKRDEKEEKGSAIKAGGETDHWKYNCLDCVGTLWAIEELKEELIEEGMLDFYHSFFSDLMDVIFRMNTTGVRLNKKDIEKSRREMLEALDVINESIEKAAGHPVNVNSPKQVAQLLYDEFCMSPPKIRGDSTRPTGKDAMEKLAYQYKIDTPLKIMEARTHLKLMSLFSDDNIDGDRMKCQYSLARTSTGRLASNKKKGGLGGKGMNLQNVKAHGPARSFFVAEEGHVLVGGDQSQAEARVVGWISKDKTFLALFSSGKSIHIQNAYNLFGEWITKDDPRYKIAKSLIHGCVTGDHEVLTRNGWISFNEFEMFPQEIAQWDNGRITFVYPEFVRHFHDGKLVNYVGTSFEIDGTPDHRIPYINGSGNLKCTVLSEIHQSARIPTTGIYVGGQKSFSDASLLLAIAIQADGSISAKTVKFHLVKSRKIDRLISLLEELKIEYDIASCGCHEGGVRIKFSLDDTEISTILDLEYNKNYVALKYFNYNLFDLPLAQRRLFLQELPFWDGENSNDERNRKTYITTNLRNAEFVQTLAHISNVQSLFRYNDRPAKKRLYTVSFNNRSLARISSCKKDSYFYKGYVYCVTVPSSYFMIRKNGKIYVSGNSNYGLGPWAFAYMSGLPLSEAKEKQNLYFSTYPGIKNVFHKYVEDEIRKKGVLYNTFGRRQVFFGRLDDTTFRAGYAFLPQSTVSDVNKIALKRVAKHYLPLLELHDGLIISVPANDVKGGIEALAEAYDVSFEIWGEEHSIPIEVTVGDNWRDMEPITFDKATS
jgi:uracil-DNA glycosylase family 4